MKTLALALAVMTASLVPAAWAQTAAPDPQSVVGVWSGTWVDRSEAKSSGRYHLTIDRVEGNKAYCSGQFDGGRVIPYVATLEGDRLSYVGQATSIELTIKGTEMTGSLTGRVNRNFSLTKQK